MNHLLCRRTGEGTTLVIVACLVTSVLLPLVRQRIAADDNSTCQSRLRQLGTALMMYAGDYNDALPPCALDTPDGPLPWTAPVKAYGYSSLSVRCPLDKLDPSEFPYGASPASYGMNRAISTPEHTVQISSFHEPAWTILLADASVISAATAAKPATQWVDDAAAASTDAYYFTTPQDPYTGATDPTWASGSAGRVRAFARHGGQVNVLFADGHVGSVPAGQFDPAVTKWGAANCLWDNAVSQSPYTAADTKRAMKIAAGTVKPVSADLDRLNVVKSGASATRIDMVDAVVIARRVSATAP
ncbi:MAG TPA: H-X9-DG-CTERM domain-containing protein [Armatimonadota bacterium]|jgi:prepilin-type processing-associated H-X9-DG protein